MKIAQAMKLQRPHVDVHAAERFIESVAIDGDGAGGGAAEIAQHEVIRRRLVHERRPRFRERLRFSRGVRLAALGDVHFDHALIIRFPVPSRRYCHREGTSVVEP